MLLSIATNTNKSDITDLIPETMENFYLPKSTSTDNNNNQENDERIWKVLGLNEQFRFCRQVPMYQNMDGPSFTVSYLLLDDNMQI
jgi:hypothetical protein